MFVSLFAGEFERLLYKFDESLELVVGVYPIDCTPGRIRLYKHRGGLLTR